MENKKHFYSLIEISIKTHVHVDMDILKARYATLTNDVIEKEMKEVVGIEEPNGVALAFIPKISTAFVTATLKENEQHGLEETINKIAAWFAEYFKSFLVVEELLALELKRSPLKSVIVSNHDLYLDYYTGGLNSELH